MASAYAALVTLLNTMDQIHNHPLLSTSFDDYQFESIREKVDFLVDFMENHSDGDSEEAEDLVRRIADVAHEAEDIIDVHAADRIRAASTNQSPSFLPHLQKRIEDMDSIKEKVIKFKEETVFINHSMPPSPSSSAAPSAAAKTTAMVGFDAYLEQLLDQLTGQHSGRRILSLVGMGGIGKTTLARNAYENLLTMYHFDVRVWITVSQEVSAREILLQAFSCLGGSTSKIDRTDDQLGEELYKILCGRRYLVVLDDVWSVEAWEKIKFFFPENNSRSRIVITTRQSELVDYFCSSVLAVKFLDEKDSWDLFCEKTFAQQGCPCELEEIGKEIVKKCKGLPLAIIVIGGLLRKSPKTPEYWEKISKDKSLILDSEEGNIKPLNILNLSYKHLPVWLKPCFLYLGLFPEDHKIDVPQLIKLWVAEGFIKSKTNQSLEEVAESYKKDLVMRNLILVPDLRPNKKFKICHVHDLVRESCIRIAEKENFFWVQRDTNMKYKYIVDGRTRKFSTWISGSIIRPLIVRRRRTVPFKSRLLRVLYSVARGRLDSAIREVNLRFLFHQSPYFATCELPSSISLLWCLQTLILTGVSTVVAPAEIWKMPQLRHIQTQLIRLPNPPPNSEHGDIIVLQNLQTLKTVENLNLSEEVCKRIPNVKELHIHYDFRRQGEESWCYNLQNVGCLNKLESLQYSWEYACDSLKNLKLPSSIRELSLYDCKLVWSDMAMIASLPHLQVLKLERKAMVGSEWNCVEEEKFVCLKRLKICECDDLIHWIADSSNFPMLETIELYFLSKLKEIPSGIGEIPTLERMSVFYCSESAAISAVEILDEQEGLGNQNLQLRLNFSNNIEEEMWREKIQELGFTCKNLYIPNSFYHHPSR